MAEEETSVDRHLRLQRERGTQPRMGKVAVAPISGKAGEILQHLHHDEPVFIFRAQDILSVMVLRHYAKLIEDYTYGDATQLTSVVHAANEFAHWQRNNPNFVKLPD